MHRENSRGYFQFYGGCNATESHVGAVVVVSPEPFRFFLLCLLYAFDDVLVQPFMPNRPVVAFDIGVLLGLSGLVMLDGNALLFSPYSERFAVLLWAIVHPNCAGCSAPLDDAVQASCHPFGGQREINLDPQPFAVKVIKHVQKSKSPPIAESVGHEVHGPGHIGRIRHGQDIRLLAFQALAWLDPQVQF